VTPQDADTVIVILGQSLHVVVGLFANVLQELARYLKGEIKFSGMSQTILPP
jgi:hypothetical protein